MFGSLSIRVPLFALVCLSLSLCLAQVGSQRTRYFQQESERLLAAKSAWIHHGGSGIFVAFAL